MNILPLIVGVYVVKVFGAAFERTVTSIKVIYFTIFYTQITHPDRIAEGLQDQLVSYLKMEEQPAEETAPAPQGATTSG